MLTQCPVVWAHFAFKLSNSQLNYIGIMFNFETKASLVLLLGICMNVSFESSSIYSELLLLVVMFVVIRLDVQLTVTMYQFEREMKKNNNNKGDYCARWLMYFFSK